MSFVEQDDVMAQLEDVLSDAFARVGVEMPTPLRRISYWDAMDTYGSDKPDTRFGMELVDLTDIFASSAFKVFASAATTEGHVVKAINAKGAGAWPRAQIDGMELVDLTDIFASSAFKVFASAATTEGHVVKAINAKGAGAWPRAQIDKLAKVAATFGAKGLAWIAFREDGSVNSPIVKFFTDDEMAAMRERMGVEPGDLVMFAAGPRLASDEILGGMRSHMADALDVLREGHDFLWVVDFPLFHWDEEGQRYEAEHQPFTLPHVDELHLLDEDPLKMGSCTYDFVMDGFEAGGGGMRIHDAELQLKMLEFMGFTEERARAQFGFLMEALEFGAPPMGGFALGLDRVCMLLAGTDSIRDVMAFPKTSSGSDLMSAAPSEPLKMGSCTYDFVMDGFEAGGGGMRIHDAELQLKMLEFMGFTEERARAQFGFLMEALEFGAPPMGGFALGLDRVCMLLAGTDSIRDVMAFPKTSSGSDLMSAAPSEVSMAQLKEVGLRLE